MLGVLGVRYVRCVRCTVCYSRSHEKIAITVITVNGW